MPELPAPHKPNLTAAGGPFSGAGLRQISRRSSSHSPGCVLPAGTAHGARARWDQALLGAAGSLPAPKGAPTGAKSQLGLPWAWLGPGLGLSVAPGARGGSGHGFFPPAARAPLHGCLERGETQPPRSTCGSRACNFALPQTQWRGARAPRPNRRESVGPAGPPKPQNWGTPRTGNPKEGPALSGLCQPGKHRARRGRREPSPRAATRRRKLKTCFKCSQKSKIRNQNGLFPGGCTEGVEGWVGPRLVWVLPLPERETGAPGAAR